jgi:hypothetical protein
VSGDAAGIASYAPWGIPVGETTHGGIPRGETTHGGIQAGETTHEWNVSIMAYEDVRTAEQCEALLGDERRYCLLGAGDGADGGGVGGNARGGDGGGDGGVAGGVARGGHGGCTPPEVYDGYPFVVPARMETLANYIKSSRCDATRLAPLPPPNISSSPSAIAAHGFAAVAAAIAATTATSAAAVVRVCV